MRSEIALSRELLPPGTRVLCAVSGGADSVCLLHLAKSRGDLVCACAHFDHGLRGEESRRDAEFTRELCREWDVPFFLGEGDVPEHARRTGQSVETAARELRYAFLRATAEAWGADVIATAHNMSDNAETVLFRLARGTGLRGLAGIPERRGKLVRPLLHVTRQEILDYLTERAIPHREDSTNALDGCARNYARHHLLPAMETLHPGAVRNVDRMTRNLAEDEAFLTSLAEEWLNGRETDDLPAEELRALPRSVARRALEAWLGEELSRERFEAVLAFCVDGASGCLELPGRKLYRRYGALTLSPLPERALPEREIPPDGALSLPEAGLTLFCRKVQESTEIQSSFNIFSFSCANICGKLSVSARKPGDGILFRGRAGTRSVKKLLLDAKIPREKRSAVPVIRDEAGVLAVYGFGQAERAWPRNGEPFYEITIRKDTEDK